MSLLSSGGGLPESGCLFFKIIGSTNLSEGHKGTLLYILCITMGRKLLSLYRSIIFHQ